MQILNIWCCIVLNTGNVTYIDFIQNTVLLYDNKFCLVSLAHSSEKKHGICKRQHKIIFWRNLASFARHMPFIDYMHIFTLIEKRVLPRVIQEISPLGRAPSLTEVMQSFLKFAHIEYLALHCALQRKSALY